MVVGAAVVVVVGAAVVVVVVGEDVVVCAITPVLQDVPMNTFLSFGMQLSYKMLSSESFTTTHANPS